MTSECGWVGFNSMLGWNGGWIMVFGILIGLIVIGVLIWFVIWLTKRGNLENNGALEILKERYVKGKISKNKFEEMKKEIR